MGLLGLTSEVLTEYRADAGQHKRELQELKLFQQQLGEEEGKVAAERNQQLGEWIERLGKVTLALVAVKEIGEVIWDGYKEGLKEARLETAAAGIDIEKLGEAAGGLKTKMELLEFAAKANKSAFHNSQEDMEMAERAMRALEARGVDAAEAQEAVTKALVEGKTKGLEPYGIVVNKHIEDLKQLGEENLTLAQKQEIHKNALESLHVVADEVSDSQENVGDSMKRAQVNLSDAWAEVKKGLGELATAFIPLINGLASVLHYVSEIGSRARQFMTETAENLTGRGEDRARRSRAAWDSVFGNQQQSLQTYAYYGDRVNDLIERANLHYAQDNIDPSKIEIDNYKWERDEKAWKEAQKEARDAELKKFLHSASRPENEGTLGFNTDTMNLGITAAGSDLAAQGYDLGADLDLITKRREFEAKTGESVDRWSKEQQRGFDLGAGASSMKEVLDYAQQFLSQKTDNVLHKAFGKVGEFDLYKKGFEALTGAVGSMYDAVVSGSESATAAFRKFIAGSVMAVGRQMAVEAVKEGAYAIGNLAFGNLAGAAAHAEAAAEFAAGAVLAGVVASELGVGGGGHGAGHSSGSGGGAGSGGSGGDHGGKGGTDRTLIVYADSFAEDSARNRAQRAERILNTVIGTGPVRYS